MCEEKTGKEEKREENQEDLFRHASEHVRENGKNLTNQNKVDLYGMYKQATKGPNTTSRPSGMFDPVGAAKWDGWTKYKSLSKESAMLEYVKLTRMHSSFLIFSLFLSLCLSLSLLS